MISKWINGNDPRSPRLRPEIIRLVYFREMRDQLRDRRTVFSIAVVPLVLYPLLGMLLLQIAQFTREYPASICVVGADHLVGLDAAGAQVPPLQTSSTIEGSDALFAAGLVPDSTKLKATFFEWNQIGHQPIARLKPIESPRRQPRGPVTASTML
ncbi:MAG: hypothetical protein AAF664_02535 [Planctomycetota bacterium]